MDTNNMQSEVKNTEQKRGGKWIWLFAITHMLCCGLPLLLLSGISIIAFFKNNPAVSIAIATIGVIGFIWYLKRGCATCPRNEGRCLNGQCKTTLSKNKS